MTEKIENQEKNNDFKARTATKRGKVILLVGALLTVLLVAGLLIFNKPTTTETKEISYPYTVKTSYGLIEKDYDSSLETISLTNADTKTSITKITLNTPRIYQVGVGYGKVAEIEFNAYEDFKQYLSNNYFELYNVRDNMKSIERDLDFKFWTTKTVEVEDYSYDCITIKTENNSTEQCTQKVVGTHLEEREVWKDISEYVFTSGEPVKIGIFTEVGIEETVEWIPTIYGVEIKEWAVYTSGATTSYVIDDGLNYTVVTYKNNGTFNVTTGDINATVLVVAGGGGSGANGGGGGAGGLVYNASYIVTPQNITVTVGSGGAASGANGGNSVFGTITAIGGGGGGLGANGASGGSGGGGGRAVGVKTGGAGTSGQGFAGGDTTGASPYPAGGGGGSNAAGQTAPSNTQSGGGGAGKNYTINGTNVYYAGGGGGSGNDAATCVYGAGGIGGGGTGGYTNGASGTANTGGGGGGGETTGGAGGSGIVIIRYLAGVLDIALLSPINNGNFTINTINFSANVSDPDSVGIQNVTIKVFNSTDLVFNETNSSGIEGIYNWNDTTLSDGDYDWNVTAYDDSNNLRNSLTRSFGVDATDPVMNISYPNETITFHAKNTNLSLNWSVNDTNLDSCWFNWNGANTTVTCNDNTTTFNITDGTIKTLTFYANDTFGNEVNKTVSWNYLLFYNYEVYSSSVIEGSTASFSANFLTNGTSITIAILDYNETEYSGAIDNHGGGNFTTTRSITAPSIDTNTNLLFFWNITQGDFYYALSPKNQTVLNFGIDNCTINSVVLYNFTIKDEETETILNKTGNNTQGRIDLQIYTFGRGQRVVQFNKTYSQVNPFAVCINSSLASGEQFNLDALIEYKAYGYQTEFYNIQNATINSSTLNQKIGLYDLVNTSAQVFKLLVKDSSYLAISDALVEVHRKYINEGVYKIVELPKTDRRGETVASLVLNDVIYKFVIKKYGVTIEAFDNVQAVCQTPLVSPCTIDFNAFASGITIPDFEELADFNFTIDYNKTSRIVQTIFVIPSGTITEVKLEVIREDTLGTAVCENTMTSSSGTLSCLVPVSFGNSTILAKLYKDDIFQAQGQVKLDQNPSDIYGSVLVALALFVMLTLLGAGMSDNPVFTVLFFMVGIILLFAMNLVSSGGFIGASATILWLIVAIIIVIIKGGNRS